MKDKKITFGKLVKWFFMSLIIFIYACIAVRSFVACDADLVEEVIYNQNTKDAFKDIGKPYVQKYPMEDFWRSVEENQLLMLDNLYYSPEAYQLQVSVKYNTSYADAPTSGRIPFEFYLLDEVGNKYDDYFFQVDTRSYYGYIRVCFENVSLTKDTPAGEERKIYTLYIDIRNDEGEFEPLENFPIYNGGEIFKRIEFSFE